MSKEEFWGSTLREIYALMDAHAEFNGAPRSNAEPVTVEDLLSWG